MVVSKPTMFLAGESGTERVNVSPLAGGGLAGSGKQIVNVFNGPNVMDAFSMRRFIREQERLIRAESSRHG